MTNFMTKLMQTARKAQIKQKESKKTVKGFTLVELIVVLVILAILAATLIPALTGYIDKANQKAAISECRSCVSAAQTLASERYATGGAASVKLDTDETKEFSLSGVKTLAEVKGSIESIGFENGKVKTLVYKSANGITITYDITEAQLYTVGTAVAETTPST